MKPNNFLLNVDCKSEWKCWTNENANYENKISFFHKLQKNIVHIKVNKSEMYYIYTSLIVI